MDETGAFKLFYMSDSSQLCIVGNPTYNGFMNRFPLLLESRATIDPANKQYKRHAGGSRPTATFETCYLLAWDRMPGQARNGISKVFSSRINRITAIVVVKAGWMIIQGPKVVGNLPSANRMLPVLFDAFEGAA
jgi:hypothetical protein